MRQLRFVARAFQTREKKNKFFQKTRFFGSFIRDTFFRWKFFSRFWLLPFRAPIEPFFMYSTHRIFYDPGRPTAADHNCQSRSNFFPGNGTYYGRQKTTWNISFRVSEFFQRFDVYRLTSWKKLGWRGDFKIETIFWAN